MIAKLTSKNQLTLPKSIVQAVGPAEYFDVEFRDGQVVLTPVRIQRGDAVRTKLAALGLTAADVSDAVLWARTGTSARRVREPAGRYSPERRAAKGKSKSSGRK